MKRLVLGTLFLLAAALPAAAQGVHFGIMGGWATPYGDLKTYANSGYDGGLTLQFGAPLVPVAFRIDGLYGVMNGKTITSGPTTERSDFTVWSGTANIVWTIFGTALPTKIYLIGGVGYYNIAQKVTVTAPVAGTSTITSPEFGYNVGLGVRFTKLFIEARWNNVNGGLDVGSSSKKSLEFIPINIGLLF